MNTAPSTLLAITPGKREFGIAVFTDAELIYSSVKTIKLPKQDEFPSFEIAEIVRELIKSFAPQIIVVKAVNQYQKLSINLIRIIECMKRESNLYALPMTEITIEQIKAVLCGNGKQTQKNAYERLLIYYPELKRYWNRPNKWQNDYYALLFSAVAIGRTYLKTPLNGQRLTEQ